MKLDRESSCGLHWKEALAGYLSLFGILSPLSFGFKSYTYTHPAVLRQMDGDGDRILGFESQQKDIRD